MPQFTILIHRVGAKSTRMRTFVGQERASGSVTSPFIASGPVHWDWLFAPDERSPLWTWSTDPGLLGDPSEPVCFPNLNLLAVRLADHRRRYLSFEGDIGRDRGTVQALARGRYEIRDKRRTRMEFTLDIEESNGLIVPDRIQLWLTQRDCGSLEPSPVWTVRTRRSSSDSFGSGSVAIS